MTHYQKLVKGINESMVAHPKSTIVMDYASAKVIASGKSFSKIGRKVNARKQADGLSIIFQKPADNTVWIL